MPLDNLPIGSDNPALGKIGEVIVFYAAYPERWIAGNKKGDKRCTRDLLIDLGAEALLTEPILEAGRKLGFNYKSIPSLNDMHNLETMMRIFEQTRLDLGGAPITFEGPVDDIDEDEQDPGLAPKRTSRVRALATAAALTIAMVFTSA